jgi:hypothetical protein
MRGDVPRNPWAQVVLALLVALVVVGLWVAFA